MHLHFIATFVVWQKKKWKKHKETEPIFDGSYLEKAWAQFS